MGSLMNKPQILVVDDEEDIRWALKNILHPTGYVVTCAASVGEALDNLHQYPYFIAFVDMKLPDQDGLTIANHIFEHYPRTSVVLISGYYNQDDDAIVKVLQKGIILSFLSKPFPLSEVRVLAQLAIQRYEGVQNE